MGQIPRSLERISSNKMILTSLLQIVYVYVTLLAIILAAVQL